MSRTALRKETSYSQFRKKNSLSKNNLHKSMLQIDNSISLIADEKTQELLSMENQLQSLVRNRSLSAKPSAKCITEQSINLHAENTTETHDGTLHIVKRNSIHALTQVDTLQKTYRSVNFQPLNNTFQIIEQSEVHNQEDNGLYDTKQQANKITTKAQNKYEKNIMAKRKNSNLFVQQSKPESKATIKDLDEMQKRLQSAKKNKKIQVKDRKIKKPQLIVKQAPQKTERRLHRASTEAIFGPGHEKLKGLQILKQKQMTPKPTIKKKFPLSESLKPNIVPQTDTPNTLIPTKMVNNQQKQKLLKQFQKIKDTIKNTQICADNLGTIRNMLKSIEGLLN